MTRGHGSGGGPKAEIDIKRALKLKKSGMTWREVAAQMTYELRRRVPLQVGSVSGAVTRWRRERRA